MAVLTQEERQEVFDKVRLRTFLKQTIAAGMDWTGTWTEVIAPDQEITITAVSTITSLSVTIYKGNKPLGLPVSLANPNEIETYLSLLITYYNLGKNN